MGRADKLVNEEDKPSESEINAQLKKLGWPMLCTEITRAWVILKLTDNKMRRYWQGEGSYMELPYKVSSWLKRQKGVSAEQGIQELSVMSRKSHY